MHVLTRALLAAACAAGAASAVHAQTLGTYLPNALYPEPPSTMITPPATNVLGAGSLGGPVELHPGSSAASAMETARMFSYADVDHNGDLTQTEARRVGISTSAFNDMDTNNDGVLSPSELSDALR